jgi:hypothetical protein
MTTEDRSVIGESGGAGSDTTMRTITEVEVAGDDFRSRTDSGDWVDEVVAVDGDVYMRFDDEDWGRWPGEPVPGDEAFDPADELRVMIEDSRELGDDDATIEGMVARWPAPTTWVPTSAWPKAHHPGSTFPPRSWSCSARSLTPRSSTTRATA